MWGSMQETLEIMMKYIKSFQKGSHQHKAPNMALLEGLLKVEVLITGLRFTNCVPLHKSPN